ncbi:MalM family protein [Pseudomonas sp.]|uniref:MalM family protein n=1 Tax=Pseudomonas sp. TaxID=306 RepID=UPI002734A978|nr:MalM family protein [Pseudomonas sp.]MDP3814331.1 MalM family protein [Pseudomonas sp.]
MRMLLLSGCLIFAPAAVGSGRYLTWVDDQGRVHNSFVDASYAAHQRQAQRTISQSDQARFKADNVSGWPGAQVAGESKRRYFTWVDANGNLHNSFHAGTQLQGGADETVLDTGERSAEYISSEVLEGHDFARDERDGRYFTWVDDQGRMHNAPLPGQRQVKTGPAANQAETFTQGREFEFASKPQQLPGLDGQPSAAMQALLAGSEQAQEGRYAQLLELCCGQLADDAFSELSAAEPRYEELNRFSPSLQFPMGKSYYAALKLPRSQHNFGLRVRSFANKQMVYPSLLFLDEGKRPTRLVSDAVYQLHGETWYRYAFIEGTVQVKAAAGERYVLLLTTDEDRTLQTLDNKPFKRPLQDLAVDESGMQSHAHGDEGAFELAIVR